jgi:hypothetical protein
MCLPLAVSPDSGVAAVTVVAMADRDEEQEVGWQVAEQEVVGVVRWPAPPGEQGVD